MGFTYWFSMGCDQDLIVGFTYNTGWVWVVISLYLGKGDPVSYPDYLRLRTNYVTDVKQWNVS